MSEGNVYMRKDGRWCAKWKDASGTWRYRYRKSKTEAKAALREALKDRDDNIVPTDKLTLAGALDQWLDAMRDSVSRRTWINRESLVRTHVKTHAVGSRKLCKLTPEDLRTYTGKSSTSCHRQPWVGCTTLSTRRARKLRYSIDNALKGSFETYDWGSRGRRPLSSSRDPIGESSDDDNNEDDLKVFFFADLGEPKEREYLIEKIGVKGYPIVAFGAGGVAKSFAMLAAGVAIASASGVDKWLGLRILEHGYVLYLDFELDVDEQHRRVRDLCAGRGVPIPRKLAYLSGVGVSAHAAFAKARAFVESHEAKAVIIDSMGLAMAGDMERAKDVLAFHRRLVNPLRQAGATPFIVDHEGKLQAGERRKDKSPIGSAYKAWAARNVLQFVLEEYDKENASLDIRVRQQKTNFTPIEPFGVRFTFEEKKVSMETIELDDENLVEEDPVPLKRRIVAALLSESATNPELQGITGADAGSIRNKLSELRHEGVVADDGYKGRNKLYCLSSSSPSTKETGDDDDKSMTVADLFANPPDWLVTQLGIYRNDPARHLKPLCSAVAAVVLEDGARALEVQEEVERELTR